MAPPATTGCSGGRSKRRDGSTTGTISAPCKRLDKQFRLLGRIAMQHTFVCICKHPCQSGLYGHDHLCSRILHLVNYALVDTRMGSIRATLQGCNRSNKIDWLRLLVRCAATRDTLESWLFHFQAPKQLHTVSSTIHGCCTPRVRTSCLAPRPAPLSPH